ncbi:3',5'-cyclic-nucleotide phosphodiesterase [Polynucleobacter sinensis]|uniref:3',5'-cyclic-nucleotide phosphodiesterase n=1 Tax=Polynucleobacter sinensis TaxID=1743157 RepID=UPI000781369A|nr:3',5'-cyclic-nucleotide phosphodiesterase [Polynucleobacter sinensis]
MTCTFRVLGCSGGISQDLRTTSFLINDNILIDAGTGVGDLTLDELRKIDYLFLTHSHLDHICSLPLMLDAVGVNRPKPLIVYGIAHTIQALRSHIFNDVIWPDFTKIPSLEKPCVAFETIKIGQTVSVDHVQITALPVNHSIPANGYWIDSGEGALVFSGDTGPSKEFWEAINSNINSKKIKNDRTQDYLQHLIIETSFTNTEQELAKLSGHYHPESLVMNVQKLNSLCSIWITHLKPDEAPKIMQEITSCLEQSQAEFQVQSIKSGQVLKF